MPEGGKLTIETSNIVLDETYTRQRAEVTPGHYVVLAVTDTGVGMTPEIRQRAFEPFFTTKEVGRGTGLGLATCHGIIRQAGGHIALYGEPGKGTTARVYLPRASGTAGPRHQLEADYAPRGTERILIVEDDAQVRELAEVALTGCGYRVVSADCGHRAFQIINEDADGFDLMVTDVVMPDLGGRELAQQVTAIRPDLKILFVSGYTEDAVVRNGVLEAGVAFLAKPFSPARLARKVRSVIDGTES
jgi:two-component system, cell cycle sensor histidine kinase and response regulator CckA